MGRNKPNGGGHSELMGNLSKYFDISEFLRSEVAARNDLDMAPPPEVVANLTKLSNLILEPIREVCGVPLIVTSGYRPADLNKLIGGSVNSDHLFGLAVDFHAYGHDLAWLVERIEGLPDLPLKQCITEFSQWVHCSLDLSDTPKRQFLTATRVNGNTVYT